MNDQNKVNIFTNAQERIIPDPLVYRDWFIRAPQKQRRIAVGTRKYSAMRDRLGAEPEWEDFLDPKTGGIISLDQIKGETAKQRTARVEKNFDMLMKARRDLAQVSTYGFEHQPALPQVARDARQAALMDLGIAG